MNAYPAYKTTEYNWLGDIPAHWDWLFLSQTCHSQEVKNADNAESNVLSLSYGRIIRKKDINFGLVPKDYKGYQMVDDGNIILRLTDLQNDHVSLRTGLVREHGIITSAYTCLVPFQNAEYLQLLLHSYDVQKYFYGLGGGVRQSIGFKDIKYTMIPFPPRDEQDRIVQWVNWQTSRIASYTCAKRREIECLRELKKTVVSEAVKGEWSNVPLCRLLTVPLQYGANEAGIPFELGFPRYIRITDITLDGQLKTMNVLSLSANKAKPYLLQDGDILFARSGATVGKTFMYEKSMGISAFAGYLIRAKANNKLLLNKYLLYFTDSFQYDEWKNTILCQSTIQNIGADKYATLPIPLPLIEEQSRIVAYLDEQCTAIDAMITKLTREIELVGEYKSSTISDAVTGKIDLRNVDIPDFEPMDEPTNDNEEGTDDEDN